ncbi:MAG: ABC transporter substrate-binding protein [Chloroflexota bacterium]
MSQLLGTSFRLHTKRLRWLSLLVLTACVLLLAACGGAAPTPAATEEAPTVPTAEMVEEPTAEPAMTRSGVLRVAMQPIVQIDPAFISSDGEVLVANHVYDYLVDIDPASNVQPRLATAWKVSDDGLTYTFTLAEGVTFHDGSPFTAADVVWTFNRLRDPSLELPTADLYQNIANIEASGELEVTFSLTNPNPFFLYDLSDNHALILKADTADADQNFNGTGPFQVTNYSPEDRIEMTANEAYFVEGQPHLAGLQVIFFNDEAAAVDALRSGQVDLVMRMSTALFKSLQGQAGIVTVDIPTNGFDLVRLRSDREPGNNPNVIQAFKLATDREAIWQLVQQGYGAVGRDTPIGPLYSAFYTEDTPLPARDVEAAKALLAEAGYPDGLQMEMHVPDTGGRPDLAAVLKEQWAEAGIDVEIIVEPESVYYGDNGWLEVDLGITGWGSRPYPQFYLDVMLKCDAVWNESHFCDAAFDELVTTAGTTLDEQARVEAYHEIQTILAERGPVIIPYFFAQFGAYTDKLQGFEMKAFPGRSDFRSVTLFE